MIQANELRIGNWFLEFGIPTQADGRFIDRLQNIQLRNKMAIDISPIPLTPEMLEKCGFVKYDTVGSRVIYQHSKFKGIKAEQTTGSIAVYVGESLLCFYEYLHQLQNLYFALTSKELEYNL